MTKIYSAHPPQRVIVSPGQLEATLVRERDLQHISIRAARKPDWNRNAPVTEFSERFKAAMRAKGWLR